MEPIVCPGALKHSDTQAPAGPPRAGCAERRGGRRGCACSVVGDVWTPVLLAPLGTYVCSREELGAAQPPRAAPQELGTEPPS